MKIKILLLLVLTLVFSSTVVFGRWLGINPKQPIPVGEIIYYDSAKCKEGPVRWVEFLQYKYEGFENNSLKIEVVKNSIDGRRIERITLPLDNKNQTLLRVVSPIRRVLTDAELLITVVDKSYRLKVEDIRFRRQIIRRF